MWKGCVWEKVSLRPTAMQTGDRPLMGTKGGAVLLLRVPAKLSLTLQLRLSSLCSLVLSESPDLGRGLPRSTWPMAEPE